MVIWVPWEDTADIVVTLAEAQTTSAYIERVTSLGEVSVKFNRTMRVVSEGENRTKHLEWLDEVNATTLLYIEPALDRPILDRNASNLAIISDRLSGGRRYL